MKFNINSNPGPAEQMCLSFTNSVDPGLLAFEEANRCGSELFVIKYVNLYEQPRSSNLIG